MIDELFEKIIYESEEFKTVQTNVDFDLERILEQLCSAQGITKEEARDMLTGVLYQTEREMFAIGFKHGIQLMYESGISSDDIHHL
ncbi:MAG: hypothetical protein K2K90_16880 [Lachnospiraceae bacterium]|nr:hypothetical protein [Lachnospiraceae bacterium]